jgi:peptide/nickel transport system ATP-binding protein
MSVGDPDTRYDRKASQSCLLSSGGSLTTTFIEVDGLKKYFPVQKGLIAQLFSRKSEFVHAVDDVSFKVERGDILGLVGESGSGKTTTGRITAGLLRPTSGKVLIDGVDIYSLESKKLRAFRKRMQFAFQDPLSSLNPKMSIGDAVSEPLRYLTDLSTSKRRETTYELLDTVGLSPSETFYTRFPHQLSGGQRQRVVIARSIAIKPEYLVADEPVAMVDVSVRAQIMELLLRMQRELNLTILLITHDLAVAKYMCNKISVMYLGKIMESGKRRDLFADPLHPYTDALLEAVPIPNPRAIAGKKLPAGEIPSALNPPGGCRFHPRCPLVFGRCSTDEPALLEESVGHNVACHLYTTEGKGNELLALRGARAPLHLPSSSVNES